MSRIETAIEKEQWEVVALYLLLGVTRTLDALPPETADALLTLLAEDAETEPRTHKRRGREVRRGRHRHE